MTQDTVDGIGTHRVRRRVKRGVVTRLSSLSRRSAPATTISDRSFNMVDFLMMSLLVTLCLEWNPVNLHEPATGQKVVTRQTAIAGDTASIFRMLVKR
jgi:hypothetical protein